MKHPHGKVINYNQLKYLSYRMEYLDPDEKKEVAEKIRKEETLMFMPNDIKETQMQDAKYQKSKYKISVYGVLQDGRKAIVILDGIKPYFDKHVSFLLLYLGINVINTLYFSVQLFNLLFKIRVKNLPKVHNNILPR